MIVKKRITSIEIKNTSWGLCSADEIITETLRIYRTGKIRHLQYNGLSEDPVTDYVYKVDARVMAEFFNSLITTIKVQTWNEDYSIEVCDGWSWHCKIRYSDNTIKKVSGTVVPPPRGNQLKNQIYKLAVFKIKPWIL